ncbi:hypothetical protein FJR41_009705 [Dolichospermum planctonicum UHCC 0167]|uniref:hypothetical protein n=1 Tax=Dolichospermum planctonicum TaxID=136072 RepID=UPI0014437EA8|nr:hypothetical protein [Dolichospermum planctonicum]MCW9681073.1 hypothetical protein [Dolichospermum planctonicum UHCC 0167]
MFTSSHPTITSDRSSDRSPKTLPCICLRYLTQALLGINRAIAKRCCKQFAPENLTLYLFTLSHSTITRD